MTVKREITEVFDKPQQVVRVAIQQVLARRDDGCRYVGVKWAPSQEKVSALVRPSLWPLILQTEISLTLQPFSERFTKVICSTQSQGLIFGDIFGAYDSYIRRLLAALRSELDAAP